MMKQRRFTSLTPFLLSLVSCISFAGAAASDPALLTIDRIFGAEEFKVKSFGPARWRKDGSGYTTLEDAGAETGGKDIVRYDPETGRRDVLAAAARLVPPGGTKPLEIKDYAWSDDGRRLLVFTNTKRVWRKNTCGDYWVLELAGGGLRKLGGDARESTLMFAKFSPAGDRVAYVREKDIYVQDLRSGDIVKLTDRGSDTIINGTSDWVYEEEFGLRDGFRWSPDGRLIAYWQFDTEGVKPFYLINYTDDLYPKITTFPYPKVGQTNPACRVGVVRADGGPTRWLDVPGDPRNHYIPKMAWAGNADAVALLHLNRLQNVIEVMLADVSIGDGGALRAGPVRTVLTERDDAWIDVKDDPRWIDGGKGFAWISERDGWRHVYRVSRSGETIRLLTPGNFDVIKLESIDERGGWIYFSASPENPTQRYLYRAPLAAGGAPERVTPRGDPGTHSYQISKDSRWAVHTHSAFEKPPVVDLVRLPGGERVRVLEDYSELRAKVGALRKWKSEFFRIEIGDGVLLDGWCLKPPDFDPEKRYPLLFYVYGEPAGRTVADSWGGEKHIWHRMLAQRGYIVASVDNRGTAVPRGRAWRKCIYRQIGILASADQAAAARAILRRWPFVDPERIGIWGWSGGGQMSLNAIFRYPDLYHTAMAIAFISDQRIYDTIYQERYMGLPEDNEEGYTKGSPITFAHRLKGNLLIVHGTGDDNCHYQSCELLINELIKHNKHFTMMAYPNRTHSIKEGENTRRHLYGLLTRYLTAHLPPGPRPRDVSDSP